MANENQLYRIAAPRMTDPSGCLSFVQGAPLLPGNITGISWLHGRDPESDTFTAPIAAGSAVFATSGSFDAVCGDQRLALRNPWEGAVFADDGHIENISGSATALIVNASADAPAGRRLHSEDGHKRNPFVRIVTQDAKTCRSGAMALSTLIRSQLYDFEPGRAFWLYDVPAGSVRGRHSHRLDHQVFIALCGSFKLTLDNGTLRQSHIMCQAGEVRHVPPGFWVEMSDFSGGAVCLVLTDRPYSEDDYVRHRSDFDKAVKHNH